MIAFLGFRGDCIAFVACDWLAIGHIRLYFIFRDCDLGKNSQSAIFRLPHLKPVLQYICMYTIECVWRYNYTYMYMQVHVQKRKI